MWVCESFFQFSAGEGRDRPKGFGILPLDVMKEDGGDVLPNLHGYNDSDKPCSAYFRREAWLTFFVERTIIPTSSSGEQR